MRTGIFSLWREGFETPQKFSVLGAAVFHAVSLYVQKRTRSRQKDLKALCRSGLMDFMRFIE